MAIADELVDDVGARTRAERRDLVRLLQQRPDDLSEGVEVAGIIQQHARPRRDLIHDSPDA